MTTTSPTNLNEVDLEAVAGLIARIQEDPAKADTTWRAEVVWDGGFRSQSRIREFEPAGSDEPTGLGGTDSAPNPVEQVLGALGNCLAVGYAANLTAAGIAIHQLEIEIEGDVDLHTFLGLGGTHAGFDGIRATVRLQTDADAETVDEIHRSVVATSPVGHTLSRTIPLEIELT